MNLEQIKKVLCQGNCSAVILSNANFAAEQIAQLSQCARLGKTLCVLLKEQAKKHLTIH